MNTLRAPLARTFLILGLAALSCNLPFLTQTSEPPTDLPKPPPASPPPPATQDSASDEPTGFEVDLEPPPPEGLIDALQANVDAGRWTYEQGLIQSLRIFTGEVDLSETYAEPPSEMEGTGLVLEAQRYLEVGENPEARDEIARLLKIVAPDPESLLEYSVEVSVFAPSNQRLARPTGVSQECAALWSAGFPSGQSVKCFLFKSSSFGGSIVRVFIPQESGLMSGSESAYGDAAMESALKSLSVYSGLSVSGFAPVMKHVNIVFSLLEHPDGDALAVVPFSTALDQNCLMVIYPMAVTDNEDKQTSDTDYGVFQQTVAHELFHCFTAWNFPAHWKAGLVGAWEVMDWWGEGAAEYFSNVVYPGVQDEWTRTHSWIHNSASKPVVSMSYDNFGFFQYLGNHPGVGNDGILAMFASMPAGGTEQTHSQQLSGYPNIDVIFHDYARAFMDGTIQDTAGPNFTLKTSPPYVPAPHVLNISQPDKLGLETRPFVLTRYGLAFQKGRLYGLDPVTSGAAGFDASRPRNSVGLWGDLPAFVPAGCSEVKYYVMMTTTSASSSDKFEIVLTIDLKDELGCDECLIGSWDINDKSFEEYISSYFDDSPDFFYFLLSGGLWRYHFWGNGSMAGEFDYRFAYRLAQDNAPLGNNILLDAILTITGTGNGMYSTDGASNLAFAYTKNNVVVHQTLYMNEAKIQEGPLQDSPGGIGGGLGLPTTNTIYSCDADILILSLIVDGVQLPPVQYDRVSKVPQWP